MKDVELVQEVGRAAISKGLVAGSSEGRLAHDDRYRLEELVRKAMWDCLVKRIIVFGMNSSNPE